MKSGFQQAFLASASKKVASLGLNRMEVFNTEGLEPINARTSCGEPWELYEGGTAGLDSK